jgi:hypothetical protein
VCPVGRGRVLALTNRDRPGVMSRTRAVAASTQAVSPVSMAPGVPVGSVAGIVAAHNITAVKVVNRASGRHRLARKADTEPIGGSGNPTQTQNGESLET